jgi:hypothetical protein
MNRVSKLIRSSIKAWLSDGNPKSIDLNVIHAQIGKVIIHTAPNVLAPSKGPKMGRVLG